MDAVEASCTTFNIESGFRESGICPLDREVPLKKQFAMKNEEKKRELYEQIRPSELNNKCLNETPKELYELFVYECKRDPIDDELVITIEKLRSITKELHKNNATKGKLLTKVPDSIIEGTGGIERLSIE